jgi:hypothetical protein
MLDGTFAQLVLAHQHCVFIRCTCRLPREDGGGVAPAPAATPPPAATVPSVSPPAPVTPKATGATSAVRDQRSPQRLCYYVRASHNRYWCPVPGCTFSVSTRPKDVRDHARVEHQDVTVRVQHERASSAPGTVRGTGGVRVTGGVQGRGGGVEESAGRVDSVSAGRGDPSGGVPEVAVGIDVGDWMSQDPCSPPPSGISVGCINVTECQGCTDAEVAEFNDSFCSPLLLDPFPGHEGHLDRVHAAA